MTVTPEVHQHITLARALTDPITGLRCPLALTIRLFESSHGVPCLQARVLFPDDYDSPLKQQVVADADDEEPVLAQADMLLLTSERGAPASLWLSTFCVKAAMERYGAAVLPDERAATKGLGRCVLRRAIHAWQEWGQRLWPTANSSPAVLLEADSTLGGGKASPIARALFGLGLSVGRHAKLVNYYRSLGFRVLRRRFVGSSLMAAPSMMA